MYGVEWCSFCATGPAEGILTVRDNDLDELMDLPACKSCADKLMNGDKL